MIDFYIYLRKYFEELEELCVSKNELLIVNSINKEIQDKYSDVSENRYVALSLVVGLFEEKYDKLIGSMSKLNDNEFEIVHSYFINNADLNHIEKEYKLLGSNNIVFNIIKKLKENINE